MTSTGSKIVALLGSRAPDASVLPRELMEAGSTVLDLSSRNPELAAVDLADPRDFTRYVSGVLAARGAVLGIGRYDEDRVVYRHSPLFRGEGEERSVHLGVDLFVARGTPVRAPLPAAVHSFADNDRPGDYGPTVLLEHSLEGLRFWTLYGHLARASLAALEEGRRLAAGAEIGRVGGMHENGGWPPHLHFQIITDVGEHRGDFPGVAAPSERRRFVGLCPDPNLILRLPGL